jgi:hypothetical protein
MIMIVVKEKNFVYHSYCQQQKEKKMVIRGKLETK